MIETARLKLIPYGLMHFEAILDDQGKLAELLGATVFENWFVFPGVAGIEAIRYAYEHLKANPDIAGWWTYLFIHHEDNALIGHGGFKGKPNEAGMVEIGYALVPAYRGRGLATEAAQGLMEYAFSDHRVKTVDAHTLAEPNPSTRVLERLGLKQVDTLQDPDVGDVWHWSLNRDDYRKV
ncbi:MAG: GNAT family N-acetyltransferase [Pyrinomonadaceae bacterium]